MKNTIILSILLFMIIFSASSLAVSVEKGKEFDLVTEKPTFVPYDGIYLICQGDQKAIPLLITNDNLKDDFEVSVQGAPLAYLSGNLISLMPNQQGIVYVILKTPKTDSVGSYFLSVSLEGKKTNVKATLPLAVHVEECYKFYLYFAEKKDTLCNNTGEYPFSIINNGKFPETFLLRTNYPWAVAGYNVSLAPLEKKELMLKVIPPDFGNFLVKINASLASNPSFSAEDGIKLEAREKEECYRAKFEAKKIISDYRSRIVQIKIKNAGLKRADYEVELDAPEWVSVEPKIAAIRSQESSVLNLIIKPQASITEGHYPVTLRLNTDDAVYEQSYTIELKKENEAFKKIKSFLYDVRYYLYLFVVIIAILFAARKRLSRYVVKSKGKKAQMEKIRMPPNKQKLAAEKKTPNKKNTKHTIIAIFVIAVIMVLFYVFSYFPKAKDFLSSYESYIASGIVILAVLILILRHYRKIFGFLSGR